MASQALDQMLEYAPRVEQRGPYSTIDVYAKGTSVLYSFDPMSLGSHFASFRPATDFGFGPGIARELPGTGGLIERYRFDNHPPIGQHINFELMLKISQQGMNHFKLKNPIDNTHIPL